MNVFNSSDQPELEIYVLTSPVGVLFPAVKFLPLCADIWPVWDCRGRFVGSTGDGVTWTAFAGGAVNVTSIAVLTGNISSLPSAAKLLDEYCAPFPLDSNSTGEGEFGL